MSDREHGAKLNAIGMSRPDFITRSRPVDIAIDLNDLDPARGFKVDVVDDPASRIRLVEMVDAEIFRRQLLHDLQKIAAAARRSVNSKSVFSDQ